MMIEVGQSIKGYELVENIGKGGFGSVFRAHQANLGREVAVKVILPELANQPEFIRRFEVENLSAMLKWLDADANRKGRPNENLARELLELFTLGIGNYGEDDVQSAARALTGWTIKDGSYAFSVARHDGGQLRLFGERSTLNGDELLQRTLRHPATSRRLAWRICKTFMGVPRGV